MAAETSIPAWYPLRSVTQRLATTPVQDLPKTIPFLASTISGCGAFLNKVDGQSQRKGSSEESVVRHKLKTQISTLLQDGSKEAQWAAVVLVKATVEAGGWSVLQASGSWVRALLGILGRPEPPITKELSIITLTRIFLLTNDNQSLVRDITTPSLPNFIMTCLRSSKQPKINIPSDSDVRLSSTVLWAFGKLLPQHPRTFKPFFDQIRTLVMPLISTTPSTLPLEGHASRTQAQSCSDIIAQRARHVFVLLNVGSSKNASIQEWEKSLSHLIFAAHRTADRVFRGLVEDLNPHVWNDTVQAGVSSLDGICQMRDEESDWPGWRGINAGLERLNGQLQTVQSFLLLPTLTPVAVPIPQMIGLADRIHAILPPSGQDSKDSSRGTPTRPEISRDEREAVWTWLPHLHVSALNLLYLLMVRFEENSASIHEQLLGATLWIFDHEHVHVEIRKAVYNIMPLLLAQCKLNQHPSVASSIATCLRVCCDDLMPPGADQSNSNGTVISSDLTSTKDPSNADAYSKSIGSLPEPSRKSTNLQKAAIAVLCAALQYLPADFVPFAVRSKIDETAVLTQSEPLLQASVLNPAPRRGRQQQSSILPFLARQFPQSTGTETLLRPRMVPIQPNDGRSLEDSDEDIVEHEAAFNPNSHLSSATPHDPTPEAFPADPENDKREEAPQTDAEPSKQLTLEDLNPASNPPPIQQHASGITIPNKRTREPDSEISPDEEPGLKRLRNSDQEKIYIAPTTAEDLPPPTAPLASESALSPAASAEPLAHLRTGGENIVDDNDSEDSSIPSIDLTMGIEDEEDDEEYESD
ncbi:MAG: hypothetical protein Q9210_006338 [Variospora velana]